MPGLMSAVKGWIVGKSEQASAKKVNPDLNTVENVMSHSPRMLSEEEKEGSSKVVDLVSMNTSDKKKKPNYKGLVKQISTKTKMMEEEIEKNKKRVALRNML